MEVPYEDVGDNNLEYLISQEEIPAYVRGLIKRAKTKRMSLSDVMDEWFEENKNKAPKLANLFANPDFLEEDEF